jgi:GNAT superfamily N-acetyltransferase
MDDSVKELTMSALQTDYPPSSHVLAVQETDKSIDVPVLSCVVTAQLRPYDRQAVLDLFARSSPQTRRDRFHHALSIFPQRYLEEILSGQQLALVARDSCHPHSYGMVIGLTSAALISADTVEVAVWVADAWQHHGVGTLLLREILTVLAAQGYRQAVGYLEPSNAAARRLIERVCPDATARLDDDILVVLMTLPGTSPNGGGSNAR